MSKKRTANLNLKQSDTNAKALKFLSRNNNPEDYSELFQSN